MRRVPPFVLLVAGLVSAVACDKGPVPLQAETSVVPADGGDVVEIRAKTEAGALLSFDSMSGLTDPPSATADADGNAVLRVPLSSVGEHGDTYGWSITAHQGDRESEFFPVHLQPGFRLDDDGSTANCFAIGTACWVMVGRDGLSLSSASPGDVLTAGGVSATADANGEATLKVDYWPYLGTASIADVLKGDGDAPTAPIPIALQYSYAGGAPTEIAGEARAKRIDLMWAIGDHYEAVASGPVDADLAPTGDGLVLTGLDHGPELVGDAVRPSDVRYVALVSQQDRDAGSCGMYQPDDGGPAVEIRRVAVDLVVDVRERATGTSLAKKTFAGGAPECAYVTSGPAVFVGDEAEGAVRKWVASWYAVRSGRP